MVGAAATPDQEGGTGLARLRLQPGQESLKGSRLGTVEQGGGGEGNLAARLGHKPQVQGAAQAMEFAVEAQKLLAISLEGSVG